MTDIVERLQKEVELLDALSYVGASKMSLDIKDAIVEIERLRTALEPFVTLDYDLGDEWFESCEFGRKILKGET